MEGIKVANGIENQCLQQLVDDTVLLGHAVVQEARTIKGINKKYERDIGQKINFWKRPDIPARNA